MIEAALDQGHRLFKAGRYLPAISAYQEIIDRSPDHAAALLGLGLSMERVGKYEQALLLFDRALEIAPQNARIRLSKAFVLLRLGEYLDGFLLYEARLKIAKSLNIFSPDHGRLWTGQEPIEGRALQVYSEQGFGDMIQFSRFVPYVARAGAKVVLSVSRDDCGLYAGLAGVDRITNQRVVPACELIVSNMSLPFACGVEAHNIPNRPYLSADRDLISTWRPALPSSPRIGVAWAGRPTNLRDRERSIPLSQFATLFSRPGVNFVALQKWRSEEDDRWLSQFRSVRDVGRVLPTFSDAAAVISQLDLVITVDTAIAHLAGALGKQVWVLLPYVPDWRWMLNREDSPWYPTARLFRQPKMGDWTSVLRRVRRELANL